MNPLEDIEFVKNPGPRCPVVLLLDTSTSMSGEPIRQLNEGVATFRQEIEQDTTASVRVEVAIITFSDSAQKIQDFTTIDQFLPPKLVAQGATVMGQGIELALTEVENRKRIYQNNGIQYYQPWIFLITDGSPTDNWRRVAQHIKQAVTDRKLSFFAVGVQGADMGTLSQIAHPDIPPVMLNGLKFRELFRWLSASMQRVTSSNVGEQVSLPPLGWGRVNA